MPFDWESLVSELSAFKAKKPRDIIYGMLALAKDTRSSAKPANADLKAEIRNQDNSTDEISSHTPHTSPTEDRSAAFFNKHYQTNGETETLNEKDKQTARDVMGILRQRIAEKEHDFNYKKTFYEVCKDFLAFVIRTSGTLDILCGRGRQETSRTQPSRPGFPHSLEPLSECCADKNFVRVSADLLVGRPL